MPEIFRTRSLISNKEKKSSSPFIAKQNTTIQSFENVPLLVSCEYAGWLHGTPGAGNWLFGTGVSESDT
jgi:hypothetical protein